MKTKIITFASIVFACMAMSSPVEKKQQQIREFNSIGGLRAEASMLSNSGYYVSSISAYTYGNYDNHYYVVVFER